MDGAALDRLEPRIEGVAVRHRTGEVDLHRCGGEALWVTASLVIVGDADGRGRRGCASFACIRGNEQRIDDDTHPIPPGEDEGAAKCCEVRQVDDLILYLLLLSGRNPWDESMGRFCCCLRRESFNGFYDSELNRFFCMVQITSVVFRVRLLPDY
jgi:hypothetical protein